MRAQQNPWSLVQARYAGIAFTSQRALQSEVLRGYVVATAQAAEAAAAAAAAMAAPTDSTALAASVFGAPPSRTHAVSHASTVSPPCALEEQLLLRVHGELHRGRTDVAVDAAAAFSTIPSTPQAGAARMLQLNSTYLRVPPDAIYNTGCEESFDRGPLSLPACCTPPRSEPTHAALQQLPPLSDPPFDPHKTAFRARAAAGGGAAANQSAPDTDRASQALFVGYHEGHTQQRWPAATRGQEFEAVNRAVGTTGTAPLAGRSRSLRRASDSAAGALGRGVGEESNRDGKCDIS
jgi:hypothetical protein